MNNLYNIHKLFYKSFIEQNLDEIKRFNNFFYNPSGHSEIFNNLKNPEIENQDLQNISNVESIINDIRFDIEESKDLNHIGINNNNINNNLLNMNINNNFRHKTEIFKIMEKREENTNKILLTKKRGRNPKSKSNLQISNISHNRKSEDNMMRKIKNKILNSALNLINDSIEKDNKKNNDKSNKKLYKIKSIYSEELNLKFNLYLILQKLKDIFCYELSGLYSNYNNKDNKALINEIYDDDNKYPSSKRILEMTFYEYYHKIFLNEDKNILNQLGINENKYNFDYYKNKIINEYNKNSITINIKKEIGECDKGSYINEENKCYLESLENLANNYESYFYNRKGRKTKKSKKKHNKIIEKIIRNKNINLSKLKNEVKMIIDKNKENYNSKL
jgi:hypothetical protein